MRGSEDYPAQAILYGEMERCNSSITRLRLLQFQDVEVATVLELSNGGAFSDGQEWSGGSSWLVRNAALPWAWLYHAGRGKVGDQVPNELLTNGLLEPELAEEMSSFSYVLPEEWDLNQYVSYWGLDGEYQRQISLAMLLAIEDLAPGKGTWQMRSLYYEDPDALFYLSASD